jgi:hypothetical protein
MMGVNLTDVIRDTIDIILRDIGAIEHGDAFPTGGIRADQKFFAGFFQSWRAFTNLPFNKGESLLQT